MSLPPAILDRYLGVVAASWSKAVPGVLGPATSSGLAFLVTLVGEELGVGRESQESPVSCSQVENSRPVLWDVTKGALGTLVHDWCALHLSVTARLC